MAIYVQPQDPFKALKIHITDYTCRFLDIFHVIQFDKLSMFKTFVKSKEFLWLRIDKKIKSENHKKSTETVTMTVSSNLHEAWKNPNNIAK